MTCSTCKYRKPDERPEYSSAGLCRRFPPQIAVWPMVGPESTLTQPGYEQHFPWMQADDWCGEYHVANTGGDDA